MVPFEMHATQRPELLTEVPGTKLRRQRSSCVDRRRLQRVVVIHKARRHPQEPHPKGAPFLGSNLAERGIMSSAEHFLHKYVVSMILARSSKLTCFCQACSQFSSLKAVQDRV